MIYLYVAIGVLDVLVILGLFQRDWRVVSAGIVAMVAVNLGLLHAKPDLSGYAAHREPPEGQLIGCLVEEPSWVYLWMLEGQPRAYRVAYSRELHAVCETSKKAIAQGVPVGLGRARGRSGHPIRGRYVPYALPPQGEPKQQQ